MTQIKKLFKLQLDNKFTLFKEKNVKKFLLQLFKYILLILAITLGLYLILNKIFFVLNIKVNAELLALVIIVTQGVTFCFAVANIIGTLYLSKDNELLIVLPVTFDQLFVSKAMILYVTDLLYSTMYMLPIFITLGIIGRLGATYFIVSMILIPILPILPIALASLISVPVMFVLKFFKKHNILSIITILVIVAIIFVLYMAMVSRISGAFNIMEKQMETSFKINAKVLKLGSGMGIFYLIAKSMFGLSYFYYIAIFLVISSVLLVCCLLLIRPFYYKIATINTENTSVVKTKYYQFTKRKPFAELLLKEIRLTFRSPSYIFQFFLFPLFMPLIVFTYDKLLISIAVNQAGQNMIFGSHILVLGIVALMSNTISSIAISKEGGTFYIAKSTPVEYKVQVLAKIVFNAIFTVGAIIVTTITSLIATNLNVGVILLSSLIIAILSLGHICHSFDMDLQNPVLDWYDNSEISSIGKSTTKSIIYAIVLPALLCFLVTLMGYIGIFVALGISILYLVGRIHLLRIRTKYYYNLMEI